MGITGRGWERRNRCHQTRERMRRVIFDRFCRIGGMYMVAQDLGSLNHPSVGRMEVFPY